TSCSPKEQPDDDRSLAGPRLPRAASRRRVRPRLPALRRSARWALPRPLGPVAPLGPPGARPPAVVAAEGPPLEPPGDRRGPGGRRGGHRVAAAQPACPPRGVLAHDLPGLR